MTAVAPMFSIRVGIAPHRLRELSVLEIADHLDYLREAAAGG